MTISQGKLRLPEGVKKITLSLFENIEDDLSEVKSIVIPKSVEEIDPVSFGDFRRLSEMVFLNTEIVLQEHWFVLCSYLRTIKIGAYPYLVFPFLEGRLYGINTETKEGDIFQLHLRPFSKLRNNDGKENFWLCLNLKSEAQAVGVSYNKDTATRVAQTAYGSLSDLSEWIVANLRLDFSISRYEYFSILGYARYDRIDVDSISIAIKDIEIFEKNISFEQWGAHETKTVREVIVLLMNTEPLKQQREKFTFTVAEAYEKRANDNIPRREL